MKRNYIFNHNVRFAPDRYNIFNEREKGRKKLTDEEKAQKAYDYFWRKKQSAFHEPKPLYNPKKHGSREERMANRAKNITVRKIDKLYKLVKTYKNNRKKYTFKSPEYEKAYHLLWAAENKFEKIKKQSESNIKNKQYFWTMYYKAIRTIWDLQALTYNEGGVKGKLTRLKEYDHLFTDLANPDVKKFIDKKTKLINDINNMYNYWIENKKTRFQDIIDTDYLGVNLYQDFASTTSPYKTLKYVSQTKKEMKKKYKQLRLVAAAEGKIPFENLNKKEKRVFIKAENLKSKEKAKAEDKIYKEKLKDRKIIKKLMDKAYKTKIREAIKKMKAKNKQKDRKILTNIIRKTERAKLVNKKRRRMSF